MGIKEGFYQEMREDMDYKQIKELVEIGKTVKFPSIDDDSVEEYFKWHVGEVTRIVSELLKMFTDNDFVVPEQFIVRQEFIGTGFYEGYLKVKLTVI